MAAKKQIQRMLEEQNQLKHKVARYEVTMKKKDRDIDEILTKGAQAAAGDSSGARTLHDRSDQGNPRATVSSFVVSSQLYSSDSVFIFYVGGESWP